MPRAAKEQSVILSVFVNRIGFGFTVFEGEALIDWGAKDLRRTRHASALQAFRTLVESYRPTVIAMREDSRDETHRSERVRSLLRRMRQLARRKGITVKRASRDAIQAYFREVDARNKYEVASEIARRFPELEDRLPRVRKLWEAEEYRMGIFDAAAVALTCLGRTHPHHHTSSGVCR